MTILSIVIVNYRTPGLLIDCLRTVYEEAAGADFQVIVVDNASGDGSREKVMSVYPSVRWVEMPYNSGFARANNEGIRQSRGEIVLLLNSDTLVKDHAITGCCKLFTASPYVACGVQLLNPDGTAQISGNYFMRGGLNYLLPLPYLGKVFKWAGQLFGVTRPHVRDASSTVEVDWINGAFLMVKKTAIEAAGLMDEDFFLYAEEAEWCSRLRKAGPLCIYGQFHVVHLQGASANETFDSAGKGYFNLFDRKGLQIMLSNFVRIRKQFGVGWFLLQLFVYFFEIPVFFFGILLSRLVTPAKPFYSFSTFAGYCKNVIAVAAKSWIIIRNRPYFYKVL